MARLKTALRVCVLPSTAKRTIATAPSSYVPHFEKQRQEYYAKVMSKPWSKIAHQYIAALEQQKDQFDKTIFGISLSISQEAKQSLEAEKHQVRDTCERISKVWLKEHRKQSTPLPPVVSRQVYESFVAHGISPDAIAVVGKGSFDTMAYAQSTLYIGKKFLKPSLYMQLWNIKNPHQIKAVTLHEIQHMMHDDIVNLELAQRTVALTNDYKCFLEQRADIMAGLYDPLYAKALAYHYLSLQGLPSRLIYRLKNYQHKDYAKLTPRDGEPHLLARASYLMQLHDQMIRAITKQA